MGGFDTSTPVHKLNWSQDISNYGQPRYWLRYCSPCTFKPINYDNYNANHECDAMWDSGAPHFSPITTPTQTRLSGSSAEGQADAQAFAQSIQFVYSNVAPLDVPASGVIYCWLDQEAFAYSLSSNEASLRPPRRGRALPGCCGLSVAGGGGLILSSAVAAAPQ